MHEASCHEQNCFVTLTYRDEELPAGGSLNLDDWKNFAKALRRRVGRVRYLQCGEYGDRTMRPHHHACLFGVDFRSDRRVYKQVDGYTLWTSPTLEDAWKKGYAIIGDLTFESAAYVSRYVLKKRSGAGAEDHYDGRRPEFITMSRRPGIGAEWYEKHGAEVRARDAVLSRGYEARPPKFYDSRFEQEDPAGFERTKKRRMAKGHELSANYTRERLEISERRSEYRSQLFSKRNKQ